MSTPVLLPSYSRQYIIASTLMKSTVDSDTFTKMLAVACGNGDNSLEYLQVITDTFGIQMVLKNALTIIKNATTPVVLMWLLECYVDASFDLFSKLYEFGKIEEAYNVLSKLDKKDFDNTLCFLQDKKDLEGIKILARMPSLNHLQTLGILYAFIRLNYKDGLAMFDEEEIKNKFIYMMIIEAVGYDSDMLVYLFNKYVRVDVVDNYIALAKYGCKWRKCLHTIQYFHSIEKLLTKDISDIIFDVSVSWHDSESKQIFEWLQSEKLITDEVITSTPVYYF